MSLSLLQETFSQVAGSFTPILPPLRVEENAEIPTFGVDLTRMLVQAPAYWKELTHLKELLGHETKHASSDGLPYTYRNALRHEAEVMKRLNVPLRTANYILNTVYDAVVDLRVAGEGLDAKGMCTEWLERFPINPKSEGSSYHLLQIIYKDWLKAPLKSSRYERALRRNTRFETLKNILKRLASMGEGYGEEKDVKLVAEAAGLVMELSRPEAPPSGCGDAGFDRNDPNVRADAAEIGLDAELNNQQLAELMGADEDELDRALGEAAEDKVRTALWRKILGFREAFAGRSMLELKEPLTRRWKPYSRRIDPSSIACAPDDPRKWKEQRTETVLTVEQEGEAGGFTKLVTLLDCSGSTDDRYGRRMVLSYIKDAAYGLLAYAKQFGLPVVTVAFSSHAWLLAKESKNYVEHAKRVFLLRPMTWTNLGEAVQLAKGLKPERALMALISDGLVVEEDLQRLAEQSRANRVVAAVVNASQEGVKTVKKVGGRVQLFVVKPDMAGKTIVSALPWKGRGTEGG